MVFFSDKWKKYNIENNKISKWSIVWFRCYFNELTVKQCVLMTQQITKTSNCIEVFLQREHTCLVHHWRPNEKECKIANKLCRPA